jgi:hypothetical protein
LPSFALKACRQGGEDLEQVAGHAIAGQLEDGRVGVFVDGDHQLG